MHRISVVKGFLTVVLCSSLILNGCYSYYALTEEGKKQDLFRESDTIRMFLNDGSVIESERHHHVAVTEPSDFIYGVGKKKGYPSKLAGRLLWTSLDSSRTIDDGGERWLECYAKGGGTIRFDEGDYVLVTAEQGTGIWCVGERNPRWEGTTYFAEPFKGCIPFDKIDSVKIRKVDAEETAKVIGGVLAGVAFTVLIIFVATFRLSTGPVMSGSF